jgi:hypothetical protein
LFSVFLYKLYAAKTYRITLCTQRCSGDEVGEHLNGNEVGSVCEFPPKFQANEKQQPSAKHKVKQKQKKTDEVVYTGPFNESFTL